LYFLPVVRHERSLTLEQLAESLRRTFPAKRYHRDLVARLERGERPRSPQVIEDLAKALDVSPGVLTADSIVIRRTGEIEVARA
jgi:transcriptional regulator with XRE-family HTH domain